MAGVGSLPRWALALAVLSAGCGGGGSDGPGIVNAPAVLSVTITPGSVNPIDIGATVQLTAVVQVQNGASQAVSWTSSASNVATVSGSGLVTAVTTGQATITATSVANTGRSNSVTIIVSPPRVVGVTLNSGARTINVGQSFNLTATVEGTGTIARTVTFTSSNTTVATVTSADGITATVQGVSASATPVTIVARSTVDATKEQSIQVTVTGTVRIPIVTPSPVNVRVGQQVKLVPTVQADPGVSPNVTYTSQNLSIATVSADGTVTGIVLGQTTVTVTAVADPNVKATVPVNVTSGVTSVSLTPDRDTLRPGATRQLQLNVVTEPGVSPAVTITSANPSIATVNVATRVVTGVALGQTYVRAISVVDPRVADSTLIVVVSACEYRTPLPIGGTVNGVVNDASCNGESELFTYSVNAPTALRLTLAHQFPANFNWISDATGGWFFGSPAAPGTVTGYALVAAGTYYASLAATNKAQRGAFSVETAFEPNFRTLCGAAATTGLTASLQLNGCGFQPISRPAGTYGSYQIWMLPFVKPGERVTITVTADGFTPLIELRFGEFPPITTFAQQGVNTVTQSFVGQGEVGYTTFTVSSANPGQVGTFSLKIEGPPSVSSIDVGSALWPTGRAPNATPMRLAPASRP